MILSAWTDKGGTGKTTIAVNVASYFGLPLVDLDPQGDAFRWANRAGIEGRLIDDDIEARAFLTEKATSRDLVVVDCPPGQGTRSLVAAGLSTVVLVPTKPGEQDVIALGRAITVLMKAKTSGNPGMEIAVILNGAKETNRSSMVEEALRQEAGKGVFSYLGRLDHRTSVENAYPEGKTLLQAGGAAANEMRSILEKLRNCKILR
jgi:cellulose biosynthesis protein BcsQ